MTRTTGYWKRRLLAWQESGDLATVLPEVAALRGCPQPPQYHAEGDALVHTLLALEQLGDAQDERVFWAVLLHDIGKPATTVSTGGQIRSHGHADLGAGMVPPLLVRLGIGELAADVAWLVKQHHFALSWSNLDQGGLSRYQQSFCRHPLFPLLVQVARADAAASVGESCKGQRLERILAALPPAGSPV